MPVENDLLHMAQKWAEANGMATSDVSKVLERMPASDHVAFSIALDDKDYDTVSQMYKHNQAQVTESFKYFNGTAIYVNHARGTCLHALSNASVTQIAEMYRSLPGSTYAINRLSNADMCSCIFETLNPAEIKQKIDGFDNLKNNDKVTAKTSTGATEIKDFEGIVPSDNNRPEETKIAVKSSTGGDDLELLDFEDVERLAEMMKLAGVRKL